MRDGVMVYFTDDRDTGRVSYAMKRLIRRAVVATLQYEGFEIEVQVSVTFTDDEGIRELNRQYRQIDRATDVLSFPLFDYEGETDEPPIDEIANNLGDIVISLERAMAQANEYGHSFEREVAFLTAHSMLHLLGYDHERSEAEDKDMRARQNAIMERLGLSVK